MRRSILQFGRQAEVTVQANQVTIAVNEWLVLRGQARNHAPAEKVGCPPSRPWSDEVAGNRAVA
ncbi:MAG: hypothetical protein ACE1ZA_11520, partial [Pseudomonadales bacterium]